MRIDHSRDIPSGANSSKTTVYIDKSIPQYSPRLKDKRGKPANLWKYLTVHETTEAKAMAKGMSYVQAHTTVATPAERKAVEADGVSWAAYTHEIDGYLDHTERKKAPMPPGLHISPQQADGHHRSSNK